MTRTVILIDVFFFCSSYLHCEWKTEKELMKDKRIAGKIRRYKLKKAQMNNYFSTVSVAQHSDILYSYSYNFLTLCIPQTPKLVLWQTVKTQMNNYFSTVSVPQQSYILYS